VVGDRAGKAPGYSRKTKNHFDPDDHSKSKEYVIPNLPAPVEKLLPILRPVLSSGTVVGMAARMVAKKGM
jgi:hypothetical protein